MEKVIPIPSVIKVGGPTPERAAVTPPLRALSWKRVSHAPAHTSCVPCHPGLPSPRLTIIITIIHENNYPSSGLIT